MVTIMFFSHFAGSRIAKTYAPLSDAVMKIKYEAATGHLWLEEFLSGDRATEVTAIWNHLGQASSYAQAMLEGGKEEKSAIVPLRDPALRREVDEVLLKIDEFTTIAKNRLARFEESGIGSDIDQQFDRVFEELVLKADILEVSLKSAMGRELRRLQVLQIVLMAIVLAIAAFIAVVLKRYETQKTQTLEALLTSEEKFRTLYDNTPLSYQSLDKEGCFLDINPAWLRTLGFTKEEVIGKKYADFLHPDWKPNFEREFPEFKKRGYVNDVQFKIGHKNGHYLDISFEGCIGYDVDGKVRQTYCVFNDISKRVKAMEDLRSSEERFRRLSENAQDMIYRMSLPDGRYEYVSPASINLFGYSPQTFIDKPLLIQDAIHPDWKEYFQEKWELLQIGKMDPIYEYQIIHGETGEARWLYQRNVLVTDDAGRAVAIEGIVTDITERKNVEEALRESEENFSTFANQSTEGISVSDLSGNYTYVNQVFCEMVGWTQAELLKMTVFDVTADKQDTETFERTTSIEEGVPINVRLVRKDGTEFSAEVTGKVLSEEGPGSVLGTIRDVTEQLKAVESLRMSKEFSENLIETADAIILTLDRDGQVTSFNRYAETITGRSKNEVLGQNWFEMFIPERDKKSIPEVFSKALEEMPDVSSYTNPILTFPKGERLINWRNSILKDSTGQTSGLISIGIDVTERAKLEGQLRQAHKMEAVGQLAGGVAHDFNNMLNVILGHADLALDQVDSNSSVREDLSEIRNAATRSADLTRQLLAFARKQTVDPIVLDLNEAIEDILKMLRRLIGEDIDLAWMPGSQVASVKIDPTQIHQMLTNLCVNARDAIDGVGRITIETAEKSFDENYCVDHPGFLPGSYVSFSVSDDGKGMAKEILKKLYEPYFTTKALGRGTGLGLSTVYGIVKQNNGFINAYSEPDQGTTINIYLPMHEASSPESTKGQAPLPALRGEETILLVEDEPSILKLTERILKNLGYTVLSAASANDAIHLAEKSEQPINLLLTDVIMPEMSGRDLSEKLKLSFPKIKHLFMSGYTANVIAHHGVLDEGVNFLQKPFSQDLLAAKIRETLAKH